MAIAASDTVFSRRSDPYIGAAFAAQWRTMEAMKYRLRSVRRLAPRLLLLCIAAGAAVASAADDLAPRVRACAACHGKEGRATPFGYYPRIAGKPAGYLFNQLVAFRDGRRHNGEMALLVEHLSDDYLREIAAWFAAQELPYPPAPVPRAAPAVLARGAALARDGDAKRGIPACVACHGARLTGTLPAIPGLLGLPQGYLAAQLGAWQSHARRAAAPDCMRDLAARLSADDVTAVSAWLASQPLPADAHAAPAETLPIACGTVRP